MRNPNNDHLGLPPEDGPVRKCILSGEREAREHLVRLALAPDGEVLPDVRAKAPGRGAWIGVTRGELEAAIVKGKLRSALARAFKTGDFRIPTDLAERIATQLQRNALDRLGLEAKSGALITGGEKLDKAARSGKLELLLHASDASTDGSGKLAQAWRVGSRPRGKRPQGIGIARPTHHIVLGTGSGKCGTRRPDRRPGGEAGERSARPLAALYRTRTRSRALRNRLAGRNGVSARREERTS